MRFNKIFLKFFVILGALGMVGISVVRVRAEGMEIGIKDEVATASAEIGDELALENNDVGIEGVNYYLPYPGILPDHPLYWLKMMRDRVVEWSLFRSERKAEYWVFLADKRIGGGVVLIDGGKADMGVDTYRKGSRYLQKAIIKVEELKKGGKEMGELSNRIELATAKYLEVLERSARKNEDLRGQIDEIKKEVMDSRSRILKILGRE